VDESKRQAVQFLEKEIKTYTALALFLSKADTRERVKERNEKTVIRPAYYKERLREAIKVVTELRKQN
jgi:hypothetical protein